MKAKKSGKKAPSHVWTADKWRIYFVKKFRWARNKFRKYPKNYEE